MAGFQIPGLGQAKPNEVLPPLPADQPVETASATSPVDPAQDPVQQADGTASPNAEKAQNLGTDVSQEHQPVDQGPMAIGQPESPPSLTGALEAAIGGLEDTSLTQAEDQGGPQPENGELQPDYGENPEWEIDSSPYEKSEPSSSDSSDDDSDDEGYELLGVEETARLLMETEGGLDDEGERGDKISPAAQLRTKNELPDEVIPKPDITITPDMDVEELGPVEQVVQATILVGTTAPRGGQALDLGSVLCTQDRVVIGAVADIIGNVQEPKYTVLFGSPDEIAELGLQVGTKIMYPPAHASYVPIGTLKSIKGSDASNVHDEEVGDDEREFSDDEKEAEYKRLLKSKKNKNKGLPAKGPHPLRQEIAPDGGLDYDDGPYKPLARPPGFGSGPALPEHVEMPPRPQFQRGSGRRGDRRGRGGRGGGRGRGGGHSLPPRGFQQQPPQQQPPSSSWPSNAPHPFTSQPPTPNVAGLGYQLPPSWPQQPLPPQQAPGAPVAPQQQQPPPPPPGWPSQNPAQGQQAANGTFINPALIAALMSQVQQAQSGQQPWGAQHHQPPPPPPPPPPGGWA